MTPTLAVASALRGGVAVRLRLPALVVEGAEPVCELGKGGAVAGLHDQAPLQQAVVQLCTGVGLRGHNTTTTTTTTTTTATSAAPAWRAGRWR